MTRLRTVAIAAIAVLAMTLAGCSSDPADETATDDSTGSAPAAAATGAESGLMLDTAEYKIAQQFPMDMELTSTVFSRIRRIPIEFTCTDNYWYPETGEARYGEDKSPPLAWTAGPEGTASYALIADDPDAVKYDPGVISPRVHWTIWNIPADVTELAEQVPTTTAVASIGPNTKQGVNDYLNTGWSGPCPPPNVISIFSRDDHPGGGKTTQYPHAYRFTIYALDTELDLRPDATKNDLLEAIDGHVLSAGVLTGEYINKKLYK